MPEKGAVFFREVVMIIAEESHDIFFKWGDSLLSVVRLKLFIGVGVGRRSRAAWIYLVCLMM